MNIPTSITKTIKIVRFYLERMLAIINKVTKVLLNQD